jgi:hypothetical protein
MGWKEDIPVLASLRQSQHPSALPRARWRHRTTEGLPVFHTMHAPTATELQALLLRIIKRLMKFLTRKGFLIEEQGMSYLDDSDPDRALGPLRAAACTYRIALGPRAGQKVLTLQTVPSQAAPPTQQRCVPGSPRIRASRTAEGPGTSRILPDGSCH